MYNCVNTSIFHPLSDNEVKEYRNRYGLNSSDYAVGFIGRLSEDKGIIELLEAIKLVNNPHIKLLIAGSTFYGSKINDNFFKKLNSISSPIKNQVIFTGYLENYKTPSFYCSANVICLPPVWEEPGAVTNIEAAACGCALVSTLSGGNKEYIGEGKSILLSKENRQELIQNIAHTIIELMNNKTFTNKIKGNALLWGKEQNQHEYYERLCKIL